MRAPVRSGISRRELLQGTAWAAGGLLSAGALAGCAGRTASAQPTVAAPSTILLASIPFQGNGNYQGTMQQLMEEYIAQNWTASHPGVEVKTIAGSAANGANQSAQQVTLLTLAGQPPDTVCGCCTDIQTYFVGNVLLPLDAFIKADNIDLTDFSPGHLQGLQDGTGRQMALPQYDGPETLVYNQGALDQLGLEYPAPNWTYLDATQMWQGIAGAKGTKRVYGAGLDTGDPEWLVHGWGGSIGSPDGTQALLNSSQAVAAFTWMVGLLNNKVISNGGPDTVKSGQNVFAACGGWDVQYTALNYQGMKWDFAPMPQFPGGSPSTFINNDFNGINAFTKNPQDLVWDLFKFITLDAGMQAFQFKTTFVTPNRKSLWPQWIEIIQSEAPPLKGKHLEYFQQAVDYGWPTYFFKYDAIQANTTEGSWINKITGGQIDVQGGLQQATTQLNGMEAEGAAMAASPSQAKNYPTQGTPIAIVATGI